LQSRHSTLEPQLQSIFLWLFYFVGSTGVWIQGLTLASQALLVLEPLHQPFSGYFGDWVSRTICPGCTQTTSLPISASQVARIIGLNHQCMACDFFFF
jgi:hypothetical protein